MLRSTTININQSLAVHTPSTLDELKSIFRMDIEN